ncbi:MAG: class I fructose-bisphosphate aldolase [Verrucomicrobiales bacterium]
MREIRANLSAFFRSNGRTLILPMDHGTAIPVPGLERPRELIAALNPFYDGYVVNYGLARAAEPELISKAVCLRTDVYKPACAGHADRGSYRVYGAEDAKRLGARAVMNMLYVHHPEEDRLFSECARLISDCHKVGLPVILEALPFGIGRSADYTPENIRFTVRAAAELGADLVKTAFPGDKDAFAEIVRECPVPVIVLGGAAMDNETSLFEMVRNAMDGGASGIAIGRNVWQHHKPERIARALHDLVHTDAEVALALSIAQS